MVKNPPTNVEVQVCFLGQEDPLEEGMATHSNILTWEIPWTEESNGLYSQWSRKRVAMTEWLSNSNNKMVYVLFEIVYTLWLVHRYVAEDYFFFNFFIGV